MKISNRFLHISGMLMILNILPAQIPYLKLNIGYGFPANTQTIAYNVEDHSTGGAAKTYDNQHISLGKGLNLGGAIGYKFNKNISTELGVSYLFGTKVKSRYYDGYNATPIRISEYTMYARMLSLIPSVVITSGMDKFNPYIKFGMIIGIGRIYMETYNYYDNYKYTGKVVETTETMKLSGGVALGVSSALGVLYKLNEKLSLFGELNMVSLSYAPTQLRKTKYPLGSIGLNLGLKVCF